VWIGGVRIAHERALKGHSDADVGQHALTDALLGAAAAGDIGQHFPPSDPQWKGGPFPAFLDMPRADCRAGRGGSIMSTSPSSARPQDRAAPRCEPRQDRSVVAAGVERVSVKATTTERLGFTGRGEGMPRKPSPPFACRRMKHDRSRRAAIALLLAPGPIRDHNAPASPRPSSATSPVVTLPVVIQLLAQLQRHLPETAFLRPGARFTERLRAAAPRGAPRWRRSGRMARRMRHRCTEPG
jgi:2-C-methyl-D-erythritol 2,4-cyclodiphosphate synthase